MDFRQLQTFYTLSNELNFTKTASKLGYTQSCVTIHIKKLEEELGIPLFDRIGKKVTLTEPGQRLVSYAHQLLKISQDFIELSKETIGNTKSIRIGICDSLCIEKMPAIIRAYKLAYPNIDIYLKILKCSDFLTELRDNKIDLAYTIGYLSKIPEIQFTAETVEPILVLASPDHPLAVKKNLNPKDFDGIPLILTEPAAYYRRNFLNDLERNGINPKIILETESIQAIKNLTASGLGVCVLPKCAAYAEINSGKLVSLDYECNYDIRSQIIWHRDKWLPFNSEEFIRIAKDVLFL
jgi:DNA-binding transcriptional LysR family regulator